MPTPERTSTAEILAAARALLEERGLPGVTMHAVARAVGVQAPSLYKRVGGRDDVIRLVAESAFDELAELLNPAQDLTQLATLFRSFGREHPAAFRLIMTPGVGVVSARREYAEKASAPVLRLTAQLVGGEHALDAARTVTAWAAGFVGMEIDGGFNLEGDTERAWSYGLRMILSALDDAKA